MKIGIYLTSLPRELGGSARFESEIVRALAKHAGHPFEFHVISHHDHSSFGIPTIKIPQPKPVTRRRLLGEKLGLLETWTTVINRQLYDQGIDLLYSPHPSVISQDIPYAVTCWDLQHRMQPFFPEVSTIGWNWENRQAHYQGVLPRAAAVITGTQQGKNEVELFFGVAPDRTSVIPFSVPNTLLETTAVKPNGVPEDRFIVYPAQFWPHKNHVTVLHALRILRETRGLELTAVFPGSSNLDRYCTRDYIQSLAAQLGVSVQFPGFVTDEELRWLYEHCEALVFASLFGPDNLPPIEAMGLRCPVIASNVPGAAEQLDDAALLVTPTDEASMASAIHQVVSDAGIRDRLIARGSALTQTRTMHRYVTDLLDLFDRLAGYRRCWPMASEK